MNVIIKKRDILYNIHLMLFVGTFIISYQLRGIVASGKLQSINLIAIIAILIILFTLRKYLNYKLLMLILITLLLTIYSQEINGRSIVENFVIISCVLIPTLLNVITIRDKEKFKAILFLYLKIFNFIVALLLIFAVIDRFTNNYIAKAFAEIFNNQTFYDSVYSDANTRYYSFMGHPLYNAQLFLMFYILNVLANRYFGKKINGVLITIISLSGVAFTASKTAIILISISLLTLNTYSKSKKVLYCIVLAILVVIFFKFGIFDNIIYRFTSGTLTSGRNEMWSILQDYNIFPIKFLSGYGSGFNSIYNSYVQGASMAFEYPIKLFQLEYGVLFTIFLYIIIFIYPLYTLIVRKHYTLIMSFIIVFLDVNTYNGIGLGMDIMLMFCVYTYIILNISNYLNQRETISLIET
ncbi:hypothetical protein ACUH7Y_05390 [Clostridium beijerinckii]|uniref:O-antigen polymerase n=1 Tax=Clostridium beijerinckii TaxID=1520 RepID=A0A7X9XP17_CLOBE|nr:hypothetical protein [Clostridium beijerinckii]NMF04833.1 hypothetical protein [Clostridium beijerinckii]